MGGCSNILITTTNNNVHLSCAHQRPERYITNTNHNKKVFIANRSFISLILFVCLKLNHVFVGFFAFLFSFFSTTRAKLFSFLFYLIN